MELISKDEVRAVQREAKTLQKVDSGISAQSTVVALGASYWEALRTWGKRKGVLSGEQEKLVSVAARMPRMIPDDRQSALLLKIKQRVEDEEGFRHNNVVGS